MAEQRKFYWLKLMDNFFSQPKIKKLRRIAGGDTYTIIYLKLQLISLMTDAKIIFENIEDNIIDELALKLDEDPDNVRITLQYLISQGLIEEVQEGEFLLPETLALIGSETASAQRVRTYRQRQKALHCNTDVQNRNREIEKEIEIDKEIDKEIEGRETPTHSPSDIFIDIPLLGGNVAHVTYEYVEKQKALFPSLDVEQQIRSAAAWIDANPSRKKKDWKRFLNGWFQRSMKYEKEDSKPSGNYQRAPKTSSDYNPAVNTGDAETIEF